MADPSHSPPDDTLSPVITHWGRDPIWPQTAPLDPPTGGKAFPGAVQVVTDTGVEEAPETEEAPGIGVIIAAHEVAYDPQRDHLYCDIGINPTPDAYYPFVRLALARFQPQSLPGVALSRVVLADFVQVPPQ